VSDEWLGPSALRYPVPVPRPIEYRYEDPLAALWLAAAHRLGWRVVRAASAYASWDGQGTLTLARPEDLDPDDSLAQMILHEMCHALVAGPRGMNQPDWGLDNTSDRDVVQEHATNRLQAALTGPYGLREFMAVTTDFRSYYDALPARPLGAGDDPAIAIAQRARERADLEPYRSVIAEALERTARLAEWVVPSTADDSLWRSVRARHRSGLLMPRGQSAGTCAQCAWSVWRQGVLRCRQSSPSEADQVDVQGIDPACERFEPTFSDDECGRCGACCREGFDVVTVSAGELLHRSDLVSESSLGRVLERPGGRCVALCGAEDGQYRCSIYAERPSSCRDFELRGDACLIARRRVGLSR
jgi:hypothetical protein